MILGILAIVFTGVLGWHNHEKRQAVKASNQEVTAMQGKVGNLVQQNNHIVYAVNSDGHYSVNTQKTVNMLTNLFEGMTTYTSGKEYQQNRMHAQNVIKDKTFFDKYYQNDRDKSGNSSIDVLKIKSKATDTNAYVLPNGQYLVMVKYYAYHYDSDLDHIGKMTPRYGTFILSANQTQVTNIQSVPNLTMENSES